MSTDTSKRRSRVPPPSAAVAECIFRSQRIAKIRSLDDSEELLAGIHEASLPPPPARPGVGASEKLAVATSSRTVTSSWPTRVDSPSS
eukprot:2272187-Prymnesium_polylepis.2